MSSAFAVEQHPPETSGPVQRSAQQTPDTLTQPPSFRPTGAAEILRMQQTLGNEAVQRYLNIQRSATRSAPGSGLIQRCNGEVHAGCACAENVPGVLPLLHDGEDDHRNGEVLSRTVQRDAASAQVVQRDFVDGTVDAPSPDLPPGSQYASMDPELLAMLGRTLTRKTLWIFNGAQATNLGMALDHLSPADINTLVQLHTRMSAVGLWHFIDTISGVWSTSSLGVDFTGPGGIEAEVDARPDFCKDTAIGESYHQGQSCWREMVPSGTPGLHVCGPGSIHIDPHQTVESERGTGWTFGDWSIQFTEVCKYSFLAWIGHMMDVEGGRDVNVFTRFDHDRTSRPEGRITQVRTELETLRGTDAEFVERTLPRLAALDDRLAALEPILRGWAAQGLEAGNGPADAQRVLGELDAVEAEADQIRNEIQDKVYADTPIVP